MERGRENSEYVYSQVLGSCVCALEVYVKACGANSTILHGSTIYYCYVWRIYHMYLY